MTHGVTEHLALWRALTPTARAAVRRLARGRAVLYSAAREELRVWGIVTIDGRTVQLNANGQALVNTLINVRIMQRPPNAIEVLARVRKG